MQQSTRRRITFNSDEEAYNPLAIQYTRKDGTPGKCNVFCGLTTTDFILILGCYFTFYSFLFGFSALLLKGVVETNDKHWLLWSFLIVGILFLIGLFLAIIITSKNEQKNANDRQSENDYDDGLTQDDDVENQ